ncbi:hypothetical protein DFH29DRAFT_921964 [Suillus ampliporus]|nr:hypothetical protein DFH29DRAFT_921964 [Suillus ampliporus]
MATRCKSLWEASLSFVKFLLAIFTSDNKYRHLLLFFASRAFFGTCPLLRFLQHLPGLAFNVALFFSPSCWPTTVWTVTRLATPSGSVVSLLVAALYILPPSSGIRIIRELVSRRYSLIWAYMTIIQYVENLLFISEYKVI